MGKEIDPIMDIMTKTMCMVIGIMFLAPTLQQIFAGTPAQALQAQAYQGITDPRTLEADDELRWIDLVHNYPYTPWITAYFIQDGPNPVEIAINYPDDHFTMEPGETITVNRSGAQERIAVIFYICKRGQKASIRVTGEY